MPLSFANIGTMIKDADSASRAQGLSFIIPMRLQGMAIQRWPRFFPSFSKEHPEEWVHLVPPISIAHWMIGFLHYEWGETEQDQSYQAEILHKLAFALHFTVEQHDPIATTTILFSLRNVEMAKAKGPLYGAIDELITQAISHIDKATHAKQWFTPSQLKEICIGIKGIEDSWEKKALIAALLPHFMATVENKTWFSNREISWVLDSLGNMAACVEVDYIFQVLARHVRANARRGLWATPQELTRAISRFQNFSSSLVLEILIHTFLPHLGAIIQSTVSLNNNQIIYLVARMLSMSLTSDLDIFIQTLTQGLARERKKGNLLTLEQTAVLIYALRNQSFCPVIAGLMAELISQLNVHTERKNWLSGKALARISQGIKLMGYHAELEKLFVIGREHVKANAKNKEWAYAGTISKIINGLQAFPLTSLIEAFLAEIVLYLKINAKKLSFWSAKEIGRVAEGLNNKENSVPIENLISIFTKQIDRYTREGAWLPPSIIARCFYGVQNMSLTETLKSYVSALIPNMRAHANAGNWFQASESNACLQGVKNMMGEEADICLELISDHLQGNATVGIWLDRKALGSGLGSLENRSVSAAVDTVLATLTSQLYAAAERKEYLNAWDLMLSIRGIQHLHLSEKLPLLWPALQIHLQRLFDKDNQLAFVGFPIHQWLAEAIFSLRFYWKAGASQRSVVSFIEDKVDAVWENFDRKKLVYPASRLAFILKLGRYLEIQKETRDRQLNFQSCSFALAEALFEHYLCAHKDKIDQPLRVLFSALVKKEKINQIVEKGILDSVIEWQASTLIIKPIIKLNSEGLRYDTSQSTDASPSIPANVMHESSMRSRDSKEALFDLVS